jgi:hypothetical protein
MKENDERALREEDQEKEIPSWEIVSMKRLPLELNQESIRPIENAKRT